MTNWERLTRLALEASAIVFLVVADVRGAGGADPLAAWRRWSVLVTVAACLPLAVRMRGRAVRAAVRGPLAFFSGFVLLAITASVGAGEPVAALRYALGYAALELVAIVVAAGFTWSRVAWWLMAASAVKVLASIPLLGTSPFSPAPFRFGGVYGNPNPMGAAAALCVLLVVSYLVAAMRTGGVGSQESQSPDLVPRRRPRSLGPDQQLTTRLAPAAAATDDGGSDPAGSASRPVQGDKTVIRRRLGSVLAGALLVVLLAASGLVLWQTRSLSAIGALGATGLVVSLGVAVSRRPGRRRALAIAAGVALTGSAAVLLIAVARTRGARAFSGLAGRATWWPSVWQAIIERPWLGYGPGSTPHLPWRALESGTLTSAHSLYLEAWLYAGVAAAIGMAGFMVMLIAGALRALTASVSWDTLALASVVVLFAALSFVEPVVLNAPPSTLLAPLLAAAAIGRGFREIR